MAPSRAAQADGVVDRAQYGTALYAPRGELVAEADGAAMICHLCGRAFRQLAPSHLRHAHGLDAAAYRVLAGLSPRRALQAPALSQRHSELLRERAAGDPRFRAGMAVGAALARSGELQLRAQRAHRERPSSLERERQLLADGAQLGSARSAAFLARRDAAARALGFTGLQAYYERRYREQRVRSSGSPTSSAARSAPCAATSPASGSGRIATARTGRAGAPTPERQIGTVASGRAPRLRSAREALARALACAGQRRANPAAAYAEGASFDVRSTPGPPRVAARAMARTRPVV